MLAPAPGPGTFHHARYAPPEDIARCVAHYWIVRWDLRGHAPQRRETLPHPSVHLVLGRGDTRIAGVTSGRFSTTLAGVDQAFGVKFRPGGFRPWLGRPVATITDRSLDPRELFGSAFDAFETALLALDDDAAMAGQATAFLRGRMPPADPMVDHVAAIVHGIVDDRSVTRVDELVRRHGLGKRALQRLFSDYVGVSPKWVINRYRLHEALERLAAGEPPDWPALALDLGYFDQAHLIRDFKRLVGRPPAAYTRV